eukprot:2572106-Rhodomonas_salina.3
MAFKTKIVPEGTKCTKPQFAMRASMRSMQCNTGRTPPLSFEACRRTKMTSLKFRQEHCKYPGTGNPGTRAQCSETTLLFGIPGSYTVSLSYKTFPPTLFVLVASRAPISTRGTFARERPKCSRSKRTPL